MIWLIFFLFLQTKPSFCRLFAWSQLDFSAIPVSISAVSLRSLPTYILMLILKLILILIIILLYRRMWQNVNSKRKWQRIQNVQEGKRDQKKDTSNLSFQICVVTNLAAPSCFCLYSLHFWGEVYNS
jgi:uncharacterized membrane protein